MTDRRYEQLRDRHRSPESDWPSVVRLVRHMVWLARRPAFRRETRQVIASLAYDLAVCLDREGRDLERLVRYAYVVHMKILAGAPPRPRKKRNMVVA